MDHHRPSLWAACAREAIAAAFRRIPAVILVLLFWAGEAQAQFSSDFCRHANSTLLVVRLQTGFKVVFALSRDGDKIEGRAQAWQSNGITAGRGNVTGSFGGSAPVGQGLVLEVYWEGREDIASTWFKGYLHNGQGQGSALDLAKFVPVDTTATTLNNCARWPEHDAAFCLDYASKAVAAANDNVQLGCGNSGPRWTTANDEHLDWCLSLGAEEEGPNNEAAARASAIKTCVVEVNKRRQVENKPGSSVGDVLEPVDPLDKAGVVERPEGSVGEFLKKSP